MLGRLRAEEGASLPLFERYQAWLLERQAMQVAAGKWKLTGSNLYSGNVSFRRTDYLAVGGFDQSFRLSEDAELGVRLELAGCTFHLSERALAYHASDHASLNAWIRRSSAYGGVDSRVSERHPGA